MFNTGDKIPGHKIKELMKINICFRNESDQKLLACNIKDELLYEYTGRMSIDGSGENFVIKEVK